MQDCKCNLHLATWTGCLISGLVFSLLVRVVICSSNVSLHTSPADLQVVSLDASLCFSLHRLLHYSDSKNPMLMPSLAYTASLSVSDMTTLSQFYAPKIEKSKAKKSNMSFT